METPSSPQRKRRTLLWATTAGPCGLLAMVAMSGIGNPWTSILTVLFLVAWIVGEIVWRQSARPHG